MKIRDQLTKKRKKIYLLGFTSWLLFAGGIVSTACTKSESFPAIMIIPFVLFMISVFLLMLGLRCPKCKGILGYTLNWPPGKGLNISEKIKYCPFCGIELDSEIENKNL